MVKERWRLGFWIQRFFKSLAKHCANRLRPKTGVEAISQHRCTSHRKSLGRLNMWDRWQSIGSNLHIHHSLRGRLRRGGRSILCSRGWSWGLSKYGDSINACRLCRALSVHAQIEYQTRWRDFGWQHESSDRHRAQGQRRSPGRSHPLPSPHAWSEEPPIFVAEILSRFRPRGVPLKSKA